MSNTQTVRATRKTEKVTGSPKKITSSKMDGTAGSEITLDAEIFSQQVNVPLMHQVITAQLAARRAGTQSTKTRGEVSGGGAKPFRQKGTGRARQGSTRAPQFIGGGVALGPKPRGYAQRTPKKMVQAALFSALSDRANEKKIVVAEGLQFATPSTKEAVKAIASWKIDGTALLVLGDDDENAYLSFRNLQDVHIMHVAELNAYDVLRHDVVIFTEDTLPRTTHMPRMEHDAVAEEAPASAKKTETAGAK